MLSGAAMAADLSRPVYKAPPAGALPVTYDWTGFYVGGHVGYGWADKAWQRSRSVSARSSHKADGFLGGGQVGFNYQTGMFVLGVEGDVSWADIKGGSTTGPLLLAPLGANFNTNVDWTATLTGRARPRVRPLAGLRQGRCRLGARHATTPTSTPSRARSSWTETRIGWTVGAGVEYAFAPNWIGKLEYNYMDFGTKTVSFAPGTSTDIDQQIHAVKFGINYKFGGRADHGALLSSDTDTRTAKTPGLRPGVFRLRTRHDFRYLPSRAVRGNS